MSEPAAEPVAVRRRSLPDSLRYLADKIGAGQMAPEAAALVLEMMAAEILGAPSRGSDETDAGND